MEKRPHGGKSSVSGKGRKTADVSLGGGARQSVRREKVPRTLRQLWGNKGGERGSQFQPQKKKGKNLNGEKVVGTFPVVAGKRAQAREKGNSMLPGRWKKEEDGGT